MKTNTVTIPFKPDKEAELEGLYIPDDEGKPRWEWPAASNSPLFLQLFQAITLRQKIFAWAVRLIFALRLQRIAFPAKYIVQVCDQQTKNWASFTGTPGPNRKQIIVGEQGLICKKASSDTARVNLQNEYKTLETLRQQAHKFSFLLPKVTRYSPGELTMEKLENHGTWRVITEQHVNALEALRTADQVEAPMGQWVEWAAITTRIEKLGAGGGQRIPESLVADLHCLLKSTGPEERINYGLAHGDFTPWNTIKSADNRLAIIDWELSRAGMPAGYDFFHFHLQQGIMVERKSWTDIYTTITSALTPAVQTAVFGSTKVPADQYLRLYLLHHISYYLELYQQQTVWHQQIIWQLDVWADALAALLPTQRNQRKMLIRKVFEVLHTQPYAVLKMDHENPEELPDNSDLDILIHAEDARSTISRITTFPLIARYKLVEKSYMASLLLLLQDGQILSLDFIWKVKHRATVFMEARNLIRDAMTNRYGIREVLHSNTLSYLRLFYGLNGGSIPEKYGIRRVRTLVPELAENSGISRVKNVFHYLWDTINSLFTTRGFTITFSGVDGAGKSTVIEEVARLANKKMRRPVIVLRHRPSVLPILSALRYGKAGAEERSVARLPRTGTNKSTISSLARFAYYYLDYLLGQWYVYFRYILRGWVVIYDRYYYDFMVDGRRSNVQLPTWITELGFSFLLKPTFNFFLYASPEVILARKKELEATTISALTKAYRTLFYQYRAKYPTKVFTPLENINLKETISEIDQLITRKILPL